MTTNDIPARRMAADHMRYGARQALNVLNEWGVPETDNLYRMIQREHQEWSVLAEAWERP